jgi:hypothetical protein
VKARLTLQSCVCLLLLLLLQLRSMSARVTSCESAINLAIVRMSAAAAAAVEEYVATGNIL